MKKLLPLFFAAIVATLALLGGSVLGPSAQARASSVAYRVHMRGPYQYHHAEYLAQLWRHHGWHTHVFRQHNHWYVHVWHN